MPLEVRKPFSDRSSAPDPARRRGSLQRLQGPASLWGWLPPPQKPNLALGPLQALWASGFDPSYLAPDPHSQSRRRGPSQHDRLGPQ